jgi:G:T-mismatch repair DNA endonuclease (very short patch repair protein)
MIKIKKYKDIFESIERPVDYDVFLNAFEENLFPFKITLNVWANDFPRLEIVLPFNDYSHSGTKRYKIKIKEGSVEAAIKEFLFMVSFKYDAKGVKYDGNSSLTLKDKNQSKKIADYLKNTHFFNDFYHPEENYGNWSYLAHFIKNINDKKDLKELLETVFNYGNNPKKIKSFKDLYD